MAIVTTFGDSIAWGQGLNLGSKFSMIACRDLDVRFAPMQFEHHMAAHSGAPIGTGDAAKLGSIDAEVPVDDPTIRWQVRIAGDEINAADVRLILLNGGINDVAVNYIVNPLVPLTELQVKTGAACNTGMSALIDECLATFVNASIVITGYYPLVTDKSSPLLVIALAAASGLVLADIPGAVIFGTLSAATFSTIVRNCATFATVANDSFFEVTRVHNRDLVAKGDNRRVAVAVPGFLSENALGGPNTFVWGARFTGDPTEEFVPVDVVFQERIDACHLAKQSGRIKDYARCKIASIGHPDSTGAYVFSVAIGEAVDRLITDGWDPAVSLDVVSARCLLLT